MHRQDTGAVDGFVAEAEASLREAQEVLAPFPAVKHAGFLHDAEKEYAEARLTVALVAGAPFPDHEALRVGLPAWLNGMAEAASELRRHILDRLREGEVDRAEVLLAAMDNVYDLLVGVDYPDAITFGLRRSTDSLRAVTERTRGDVTIAAIHRPRP